MTEAKAVDFGGWLTTQLERKGWSRHHFAQRAGLHPPIVYKWTGNEQRPSPRHCVTIADTIGVDLDLVLAAAGHRVRDERVSGVIRAELAVLLNRIPEALLIPLVPMLRGLTERTIQDETQRRLKLRLVTQDGADA